jgi:hypothetical protein
LPAFCAACSAARRTFELFGSRIASSASSASSAATSSAVDGFEVWPPSTIRIGPTGSATLSNRFLLPSPATTATTPHTVRSARSGTTESRRSRCSCWSCMLAISTPWIVPAAVPIASAAPGSSVWT